MKYLVLRPFTSYGVYYRRGDVVDASKIRSPRLRVAEGKIVEAVSSSVVPGCSSADATPAEQPKEDKIDKSVPAQDKPVMHIKVLSKPKE